MIVDEFKEKFLESIKQVMLKDATKNGIGMQNEKVMHSVCKHFFEPDESLHEVHVGRRIADIRNDWGITEIQTRNFSSIRQKLTTLLTEHRVRLVYPLPQVKWISWVDTQSGECSPKRRSPKKVFLQNALTEFVKITECLKNKNLTVCILMLEATEYRFLNGRSKDKKKGSVKCNTIPLQLLDMITFEHKSDYLKLLPEGLPEVFSTKELVKAGLPYKLSSLTLNVLCKLDLIENLGREGRVKVYCK